MVQKKNRNGNGVLYIPLFNMLVKLCLVSIFAVLSCDCLGKAARIPTFKCMQIGWDMCNIRQIDITPADRMIEDRSCFVDRGSNITIGFNFTPRFETFNLKWSIWVETVIGDYRLDGVPSDARNLANYPTIENKLNHFQSVIHIPSNTRAKLWVVRVTITGDSDRDVCCFLCEIRVRKPQLTTVSSTDYDSTNPYDIIRKKISYPSIWDFNKIVKNFQNNPDIFNKFILNNAVAAPRPSILSVIKNSFKRLFGFKSEPVTPCKVPFLGNASSLIEYFSDIIDQDQSKQNQSDQDTIINDETTSEISILNTEPVCTSTTEIITEESTTTELTIIPTINTEFETVVNTEEVLVNTADYEQNFAEDDENGSRSYENDDATEQTTTSTVETTHAKRRTRSKTIRNSRTSKKGKGRSAKVSKSGVKKTVKPTTK